MIKLTSRYSVLMAGILIFTSSVLQAQTKKDAADIYNQGVAASKNSLTDSAIYYFEKSIEISDKVGDDAKDIKEQARKILPSLYFNKVAQYVKEKQFPECIAASKIAVANAEKYGNDTIKKESLKIMYQVYFSIGNNYFKNNELGNAILSYDSALSINPNYTKAIVNKAMVYIKMENNDKFTETIDLAISQYKAQNDTNQVSALNKKAREYFRKPSSKAIQAKKFDEALTFLNMAVKYGYDKEIYLLFADVYNEEKKYSEALINAKKGLDLETGDEKAKAKFYYRIGVSQLGTGNKDDACNAFKNALSGTPDIVQAAKGQMANNKCPGAEVK